MADNQHALAKIGHLVLRVDELVSYIEHLQGESAKKDAEISELKEELDEFRVVEDDESCDDCDEDKQPETEPYDQDQE